MSMGPDVHICRDLCHPPRSDQDNVTESINREFDAYLKIQNINNDILLLRYFTLSDDHDFFPELKTTEANFYDSTLDLLTIR